MKFPESVFDTLPRFHGKIEVSFRKIMKTVGPYSGVATSLAKIVDDKKSRSAWLSINSEKHSWYIIERCYWKLNEKVIPSNEKKEFEDEEILRSPTAWLNNRIMDAAQKLIFKKLGADDDYQSILNIQ